MECPRGVDEILALEVEPNSAAFQRKPALSALQRWNRHKRAFLVRELAAATHLPPHGALFSQQLLDLTHRGGQKGQIPTLHSAWTVQKVITEECRIVKSVHCELGTPTKGARIQVLEKRLSLWCQQCQQHWPQSPRSLLARVPSGVLARGAQNIADVHAQNQPFSLEARPSCIAPRGSSRARSGFVSRLPEHTWGNAAVARFVSSGACLLTLSPIFHLKDVFWCRAQLKVT